MGMKATKEKSDGPEGSQESATPNLDQLQRIRKTFSVRLAWAHAAIIGGLALIYISEVASREPLAFLCGVTLTGTGTLAVGTSMLVDTLHTRKIRLTAHERTVVAQRAARSKAYRELPRAVRWWRRAFSIMRWVGFAIVFVLACAVVFTGAHPAVFLVALFMLVPPVLIQRYSEDLIALWVPDVDPSGTLAPIDFIKGTTTGREVFAYWLAFIGLMLISGLNLDNTFDRSLVTPVLVLLSIGSTGKMLSSGHKEFAEVREAVLAKARAGAS
ncbi:hypothetical protein ARTSIC4J27_983 [Pseudarthrobacter siccitolerans]|uniref:Uncharacterized protein n=1 Tax=Pseudarthrobacter siccitolerans TaxID=861266 RepID=A0A024GYN3_9MICC|nr:hypothetical protein [Pseudarthrobacter siccitolerans]CCQ45050.1 hypothetical protein ARTSIC4J27_983 [Pseudarthrobacter siccitolerans]